MSDQVIDPKEVNKLLKEMMNSYTREDHEKTVSMLLKKRPFYGVMLQMLNCKFILSIPTARVMYNKLKRNFELHMNPGFMVSLTPKERAAVLIHELHHITYGHVYYDVKKEDMKRWNVAMDISINQRIADLPKGAIFVENFKDKNKNPFPLNQTTERYYDLLDGSEYEGKDEKGNQKTYKMSELGEFDTHDWEDADKSDMKQSASDLMKRTLEKSTVLHSNNDPNSKDYNEEHQKDLSMVQESIERIKKDLSQLDYVKILKRAIKKSLPARDRTNTWTKPSKRFGYVAPGRKYNTNPKIDIYFDTSGSISINEFKENMKHIVNIVEYTNASLNVLFFHTSVYSTVKYKKNSDLSYDSLEIGGTDLTDVVGSINKRKSDLSIILTDGHYSDVYTPTSQKIVFIITKHGTTEHPLRRLGPTVQNKE